VWQHSEKKRFIQKENIFVVISFDSVFIHKQILGRAKCIEFFSPYRYKLVFTKASGSERNFRFNQLCCGQFAKKTSAIKKEVIFEAREKERCTKTKWIGIFMF
jgi:hypothetical protein